MTPQRKIATLLTFLLAFAGHATDVKPIGAARAAEPGTVPGTVVEREFIRASKEALDLLHRDSARPRADWVVMAAANAGRWNFTLVYTKGKRLAVPSSTANNPAERAALPPLTGLVLPRNGSVELNISSNNDIDAFEVPGLGIKVDALPGRIERRSIDTTKPGVFSSKCTEPCNAQANSMVFAIHVVDTVTFLNWEAAKDAASVNPAQR